MQRGSLTIKMLTVSRSKVYRYARELTDADGTTALAKIGARDVDDIDICGGSPPSLSPSLRCPLRLRYLIRSKRPPGEAKPTPMDGRTNRRHLFFQPSLSASPSPFLAASVLRPVLPLVLISPLWRIGQKHQRLCREAPQPDMNPTPTAYRVV